MNEESKKEDSKNDDAAPAKEEDFTGDSLLSFADMQEDDKTIEVAPEQSKSGPPDETLLYKDECQAIDVKGDDVLAAESPIEMGAVPEEGKPPVVETAAFEASPSISTHPMGEESPAADGAEHPEGVVSEPQPVEYPPEGKMKIDDEYLAKLDAQLKDELLRLKESARQGMIPGRFLEARKALIKEGLLECPQCKIKVTDTPGKIDYCPQCGLALDDYLGQYRREWESKYKLQKSEGVREFGPQKDVREATGWERWKAERGIDPDAELLECPQCGMQVYDDPFIANKCPSCHIPLDLHLQFPRPYVRARETKRRMHRVGMDEKLQDKIEKLDGE